MTETKLPKIKPLGRPKSKQKRYDIISAATELFLSKGFSQTSMELVAKHAEVSEQTLYSHFKNKAELYREIIEEKCHQYRLEVSHLDPKKISLKQYLQSFGLMFMNLMHDENVVKMYRLLIGNEAENREISKIFYDSGPSRVRFFLAQGLEQYPEVKTNAFSSLYLASSYLSMLLSDFHLRSLLGLAYQLSDKEKLAKIDLCANGILSMIGKASLVGSG
jgi:TetR/AcrR family transcriptional repressor of mexJK operon